MKRVLHWLRSDLRSADNTALLAARQEGEVAALYIATPAQWDLHHDAPIKRDFWRRNLQLLEGELAALGIPLLFAEVPDYAAVPALFEHLLGTLQITSVHCNREYPLNELHRDQAVAEACATLGIAFTAHEDQVLTAPATILNKSGLPFKVFTPYAKTVREYLHTDPVTAGSPLRKQTLANLVRPRQCLDLAELSWPQPQSGWEQRWPAGEAFAAKQLKQFCQTQIADYKEQRDLPASDGTSGISHLLAAGVLSIRQCWLQSKQWQANSGVQSWQNELLWRDFYKSIMWHFPRVCMYLPWKQGLGYLPWRHDRDEFARWCEGRTGIPIIDAAMRQLVQTGWMHNRLRMIVAMFLSKHLLIDWRWGERFFMQHLIDGDFSANNGGWQWSASTGTDAVPYFRIFNPVTQSRRFDAQGGFLRQYLPELAQLDNKSIHDPGKFRPASYPLPMIDLGFGRERALNAFKNQSG